jgi:hypothetical protein
MRLLPRLIVVCTALLFVSYAPWAAAETFRWEDQRGQIIYGSKPPPSAKNVTRTNGVAISRYSSRKVIGAYHPPAPREQSVRETPLLKSAARLEQRSLACDVDENNEVPQCTATLVNSGEEEASGITVSFLFPEGSLSPAAGPGVLAPGKEGSYDVMQLPLKLRSAAKKGSKAEVIITFDQAASIPLDDSFAVSED